MAKYSMYSFDRCLSSNSQKHGVSHFWAYGVPWLIQCAGLLFFRLLFEYIKPWLTLLMYNSFFMVWSRFRSATGTKKSAREDWNVSLSIFHSNKTVYEGRRGVESRVCIGFCYSCCINFSRGQILSIHDSNTSNITNITSWVVVGRSRCGCFTGGRNVRPNRGISV